MAGKTAHLKVSLHFMTEKKKIIGKPYILTHIPVTNSQAVIKDNLGGLLYNPLTGPKEIGVHSTKVESGNDSLKMPNACLQSLKDSKVPEEQKRRSVVHSCFWFC